MLTEQQVIELGYTVTRQLDDGTWLAVLPMGFGNGRLFYNLDCIGFEGCYCYKNVAEATAAMWAFDPDVDDEPQGWFKDPKTGRMRPGGDKALETYDYVL